MKFIPDDGLVGPKQVVIWYYITENWSCQALECLGPGHRGKYVSVHNYVQHKEDACDATK